MKRYWDSSALVDSLYDPQLEGLRKESDQWTRPHSLVEMFSTLTGGRLGFQVPAADAAQLISQAVSSLDVVELDATDVQRGLAEAQSRGVRGGRVHDWMHAVAARKAKVEVLLTLDGDFGGLADGFRVETA